VIRQKIVSVVFVQGNILKCRENYRQSIRSIQSVGVESEMTKCFYLVFFAVIATIVRIGYHALANNLSEALWGLVLVAIGLELMRREIKEERSRKFELVESIKYGLTSKELLNFIEENRIRIRRLERPSKGKTRK
jgi:hypothetical protein